MRHNIKTQIFLLTSLAISCSSKLIEPKLTSHQDKKLVVEGTITDSIETQEFQCHLSSQFGSDTAEFVTTLSIKVYTDEGIYTYSHIGSGIYHSDVEFKGISGQNYFVEVVYNEITYSVETKMSYPIYINSVSTNYPSNPKPGQYLALSNIELNVASESDQYLMYNVYRGTLYDTGWFQLPTPNYWVMPVLAAPTQTVRLYAPDYYEQFYTGDVIKIEVFAISKDVGEYLLSLRDYIEKELPNSQFHNPPYYYENGAYGLAYGYCYDTVVYQF